MAEYIERQKVFESLPVVTEDKTISLYGAVADFMVSVSAIQSEDVAPVRHGRWICIDTDDEQFFLCNRCKKKEYWESNYCPNCGSRMDGDER